MTPGPLEPELFAILRRSRPRCASAAACSAARICRRAAPPRRCRRCCARHGGRLKTGQRPATSLEDLEPVSPPGGFQGSARSGVSSSMRRRPQLLASGRAQDERRPLLYHGQALLLPLRMPTVFFCALLLNMLCVRATAPPRGRESGAPLSPAWPAPMPRLIARPRERRALSLFRSSGAGDGGRGAPRLRDWLPPAALRQLRRDQRPAGRTRWSERRTPGPPSGTRRAHLWRGPRLVHVRRPAAHAASTLVRPFRARRRRCCSWSRGCCARPSA